MSIVDETLKDVFGKDFEKQPTELWKIAYQSITPITLNNALVFSKATFETETEAKKVIEKQRKWSGFNYVELEGMPNTLVLNFNLIQVIGAVKLVPAPENVEKPQVAIDNNQVLM